MFSPSWLPLSYSESRVSIAGRECLPQDLLYKWGNLGPDIYPGLNSWQSLDCKAGSQAAWPPDPEPNAGGEGRGWNGMGWRGSFLQTPRWKLQ